MVVGSVAAGSEVAESVAGSVVELVSGVGSEDWVGFSSAAGVSVVIAVASSAESAWAVVGRRSGAITKRVAAKAAVKAVVMARLRWGVLWALVASEALAR